MKTLASPMPVIAAIAAVFALSCLDAGIKELGGRFPTLEIVLLRYGAGALWCLPVFAWALVRRRTNPPSRGTLVRSATRALIILATAAMFFEALTRLPLAEAVAIVFTAPLFMALLGRLVLKEPVGKRAATAIATGFLGLLIMASGRLGGGAFGEGAALGYLLALGGSLTYSLAMILTRRDSATDGVITLVSVQNLCAAVFAAPLAASVFVMPAAADWALVALIGLLGTAGHLALAWAYANAPAARLAPIEFTGLVWAPLFGFAFFAEVPAPPTIAGALLIVVACLIVARPARAAT